MNLPSLHHLAACALIACMPTIAACSSETDTNTTSSSSSSSGGGSGGEGGSGGASTGEGGSGGEGGGSGGAGGGEQAASDGVALPFAALPSSADSGAWLDDDEAFAEDTLIIAIEGKKATNQFTCPTPDFASPGSTNHWHIIIGLGKDAQKPGTYDLADKSIIAYANTWLTDGDGNGGGLSGALTEGKVTIAAVDEEGVTLSFSGLSGGDLTWAESEQHAVKCP